MIRWHCKRCNGEFPLSALRRVSGREGEYCPECRRAPGGKPEPKPETLFSVEDERWPCKTKP